MYENKTVFSRVLLFLVLLAIPPFLVGYDEFFYEPLPVIFKIIGGFSFICGMYTYIIWLLTRTCQKCGGNLFDASPIKYGYAQQPSIPRLTKAYCENCIKPIKIPADWDSIK